MKEIPYDSECSVNANYQHLSTVFEGYRAYMLTPGLTSCPYSRGSAHAFSWEMGVNLAKDDTNAG